MTDQKSQLELSVLLAGRIFEEEAVFILIQKVSAVFHNQVKCFFYFTDQKTMNKMKSKHEEYNCLEYKPNEINHQFNYVVSIGGDGTILYAAKDFINKSPPFITFQRGTLGFMCKFQESQIEQIISKVIQYQKNKNTLQFPFQIQETMRLSSRMIKNQSPNEFFNNKVCINQVYVSRNSYERITMQIFINDEYITQTAGDGILISTPTGSTAYSLSAGGPIMQNGVNGILIVPIAPNSLSFRPICLPSDVVIKIRLSKVSRSEGYVSYDGQSKEAFNHGDIIVIKKAEHPLVFLQPKKNNAKMPSWIQRLKFFLGWNEKFKIPDIHPNIQCPMNPYKK